MEGILKRRYPNSLPALILAASAAGDTVDRNTVEFMEKRIKKLEADLEGKDEEAKRSLRTMEQEFQKMKVNAIKMGLRDGPWDRHFLGLTLTNSSKPRFILSFCPPSVTYFKREISTG